MPLYMFVRPSKKGRAKETKGLRDHMRSKRMQANPAAPQGAIPCYTVEAPQEFDEPGKELGPDAQVWKTYVREADQVDEELVDGWNKSMDVILIFVRLFSHHSEAPHHKPRISTGGPVLRDLHRASNISLNFFKDIDNNWYRFVIESYKNLKQDPADLTSETLLAISKTLTLIANGSQPSATSPASELETPEFKASAKAICVNVLWFLSLSLSVAVSLISMLAKEWCLEFMAGRTGPAGPQARRRQQRWDGIKGWRMKEVIVMLPSLIHLSLLLFAIGLCVFLWDVHYGVAIPVVGVTILAAGAYFACTFLPFLYDFCPYGTVLSRLYKQFNKAHSQPTETDSKQDEVTARALHWMIVNCETPRSVDVALQSLSAADENLPPGVLEECYAWTLAKRRLESADLNEQSKQDPITNLLYERALNSLPTVAKQLNNLNYGKTERTSGLKPKIVLVQSCINGLVHQLSLGSLDRETTSILKRCTEIVQNFLSKEDTTPEIPSELKLEERQSAFRCKAWFTYKAWFTTENYTGDLLEDIEKYLETYLSNRNDVDSVLCSTLAASLAFALCCNEARGLTSKPKRVGFYLRLNRMMTLASDKNDSSGLAIGTLLISISCNQSRKLESSPMSMETALDTIWGGLMMAVYSDRSALMKLDPGFLVHNILHVLANPHQYHLTYGQSRELSSTLEDLRRYYNHSAKIQDNLHAQYIQDITKNLVAACDDISAFTPQFIHGLNTLVTFSPWDDSYLLPTPELYIFSIEAVRWAGQFGPKAYRILASSPFPKPSPQLIRLLPCSKVMNALIYLKDAGGSDERGFALAQLWLWFYMPLQVMDRENSSLNILESTLLQYPGLENNLEKQMEVMEELEIGLALLLGQYRQSLGSDIGHYMCRVLELMFQWKGTPLPKSASKILERVPNHLRGFGSFVDLEAERSAVYPDVEFDSQGEIVSSAT